MLRNRRVVLGCFAGGLAWAGQASLATAAVWPEKPLVFVVPYPAGGITDIQARTVAKLIGPALGQAIVVDNRSGAGGTVGTTYVARQPPDGYTLMIGTQATHAANSALYKGLRYDVQRDFVPVHGLIETPPLLAVHPSRPYRTAQEFIEHAKAHPGAIRYASAGVGSGGHLIGERFQQVVGVKLTHIPYKGTSQVVGDLIGGHVDAAFDPPITLLASAQTGQTRPLMYLGATRLPSLPAVPTAAESGLPEMQSGTWTAIYMRAATPDEIVSRVANAVAAAMKSAEMQQLIDKFGGRLMHELRGKELQEFQRRELATWRAVVQNSGATSE